MKLCKKCNNEIPNIIKINGKRHNISSRVYCINCSPFGEHNTQDLTINKTDTKHCCRCKLTKPITDFYKRRNRPGVTSYCKECQNTQSVERQQTHKKLCIEYKGGKCQHCGYDKHPSAMQFHHRDPQEKDYNISSCCATTFNDSIKTELDKCDLVCANCHFIIHSKS